MADTQSRWNRTRRFLQSLCSSGRRAASACRSTLCCEALEDRSLPSVTLRFDYSLDTNHFFDTQAKKDLLTLAGQTIAARLGDSLTAIAPSGNNTWTPNILSPATGQNVNLAANLFVPANTIIIYAGGRNLSGGGELGMGATAGFNASGNQAWFDTINGRGQANALLPAPTDFAPYAGSLAFDTSSSTWYFGSSTAGLDNAHDDFLSVATHELGHVLGVGTAPSWQTWVSGASFTGPAATAEHGGTVPLDASASHWADGTLSGGVSACMDPVLMRGTRHLFTPLDFAGLQDIGWQVSSVHPTVQFASAGESVLETAAAFRITVALAAVSATDTTIPFTHSGSATAGTDYFGLTSSPLVIPAGQTTATIAGTLLDDGAPDGVKTLTFTLGTPTNAALGSTTSNTLTVGESIPGFAYDPSIKALNISGSNLMFTQATVAIGGGALTTYTFAIDRSAQNPQGSTATFVGTALTQVIVNGSGSAILITNDTYIAADGSVRETAETVRSGPGGGVLWALDASGNIALAMQLNGFTTSYAYVGRADNARLDGVAGNLQNTFVSAGNYSYIFGGGEFHLISGASAVYAYALTSADQAWHYDAAGGLDAFVASSHAYSYLSGTDSNDQSFFNEAVGYAASYGISTHGNAIAYLLDSPGNDAFVGSSTYSYLSGPGSFNVAEAFAMVYAESFVGGTDYAYNYDPTRNILAGFIRLT
jgi:hypothetical protein